MSSNHQLRETIIKVSSELFMQQSYAATSIKQIAKAAGCTTAALYYYFEEGKEAILHEAIDHCMPDLMGLLEPLQETLSLYDLSIRLGVSARLAGEDMMRRTRWLLVEFPNMGQEERAKLHKTLIQFHQSLADLIEPYLDNRQDAEILAWIQYCALFGYGQLFVTLDLASVYDDPPGAEYIQTLAEIIGSFAERQSAQ